jgi:transposase
MPKKKSDFSLRSLKTSLHTLIKHPENIDIIKLVVQKVNYLRSQMLQFSKLYLIYLIDHNLTIPEIDMGFFRCIIRVLTFSDNKRKPFTKNEDLFLSISQFYNDHYIQLIFHQTEPLIVESYKDTIDYMIIDVITDLENNIKMRYFDHVKCYFKAKLEIKEYDPDKYKLLKSSINDFFDLEIKNDLLPDKKFKKNSILYDIKCSPQDYIPSMIFMSNYCEKNEYQFLNVFPLKRSNIPGHVRLDTGSLLRLFVKENKKMYSGTGWVEFYKDILWSEFFKTDKKYFNSKNYKFSGSIQTDGFSITILQESKINKIIKKTDIQKELYITDINKVENEHLSKLNIIAIDPNKDDLIYCSTGSRETEDFKVFRYTQNQRSKETNKRKNRKILIHEKEIYKDKIVLEKESELSIHNSKTNDFNKVKEYIKKKNEVNYYTKDFYERLLWRKLKLSVYKKTQRSEMKMVNRFKEKLGRPDNTFIAFGDWSQKSQMKYKEPSKGKSFRNLFRKAGYKVYLVDEYKTSKQCCNCEDSDGICEKFLTKRSPRPWKKETNIICHGVVKCKTCSTIFNRDVNSSINISKIAKTQLKCSSRPEYLCR